jgi:hypothetical protein
MFKLKGHQGASILSERIDDKYSQTERKRKLRWIHMMCMFTQFNSSYTLRNYFEHLI